MERLHGDAVLPIHCDAVCRVGEVSDELVELLGSQVVHPVIIQVNGKFEVGVLLGILAEGTKSGEKDECKKNSDEEAGYLHNGLNLRLI